MSEKKKTRKINNRTLLKNNFVLFTGYILCTKKLLHTSVNKWAEKNKENGKKNILSNGSLYEKKIATHFC